MVSHSPLSPEALPSPPLLARTPLRLVPMTGNDKGPARLELQAQEGSWWITQSGRAADIILQPGERISLGWNGLLLAEPLIQNGAFERAPAIMDNPAAEAQRCCLALPCCQLAISRRYFATALQGMQSWENVFHSLLWASSLIALAMFVHGIF